MAEDLAGMGRRRVWTGKMLQGDTPDWEPLLGILGEGLVGDFMWMFEVELSTGVRVQAYKHIDTRRYVHLDSTGNAYVDEDRDRYRSMDVADVLTAVFATLPGLAGVTADQVKASLAAVERLRQTADARPANSST